MRHPCESGLRENRTSRLRGGRRPARRGASSDPTAAKPTNKGAQETAESVERRPTTNGNPRGQSTGRTQSRATVAQAAERIRQFVKREPQEKLAALLHHVTPEALRAAYYALKREAALGVDGMRWREYETGLEGRTARPAPTSTHGSVPSDPSTASQHRQAGRGPATAGGGCPGRQDRPEGRRGSDPDTDLRGGVSRHQLWVSTGARGTRCVGRTGLRHRTAQGELDTGRRHSRVLRHDVAGPDDQIPGASDRRPAGAAADSEVAARRRTGRRPTDRHRAGYHAGVGDFTGAREYLPALRAGPVGHQEVATAGSERRPDHSALRR